MTPIFTSVLSTLILSSFCSQSFAATANTNIQVNSILNPTCLLSLNSLTFGEVVSKKDKISDVNESINIKCSKGLQYEIIISSDSGTDGYFKMSGADPLNTDKINYQLSITPGDGNSYGNRYISFGTGGDSIINFKGIIDHNQYVKPDVYSDHLIVTVNY